jgi:hypothetical protein
MALFVCAAATAWLACAEVAQAGIIVQQQFDFSAEDLAKSLDENTASSAAGASRTTATDVPLPNGEDRNSDPLSLLDSHLPSGSSSSSTSSSSGGAVGSGLVVCFLNSVCTLRDDSPLGQLAEDHGLSLPDPPGTDLLRPPQG